MTDGDPSRRVLRGGSWFGSPQGLRSAIRLRVAPGDRDYDAGFRIARTL
jgi:formylglycine-generating enzyme required for sulfatase activity